MTAGRGEAAEAAREVFEAFGGGDGMEGPMSEDLEFKPVRSPTTFRGATGESVSYRLVFRGGVVIGFLWAAANEEAGDFQPRQSQGDDAFNMAFAWVDRLRWALSAGMIPQHALEHWAGAPEDPQCGYVASGSAETLPSLYALKRKALDIDHATMVRGCLLGGALGDALGYPVEFDALDAIKRRYGRQGIAAPAQGTGEISDDTQMTLFTAEGLIDALARGVEIPTAVYRAHLRWLGTQTHAAPSADARGLGAQPWLYARRAPGNACLSGLSSGRMGTMQMPANPNSKGCGAVMRSAPFGLVPGHEPREAFANAVVCGVQSHGHPSGYLAAGAFAALIRLLYEGVPIETAVPQALEILKEWPGNEEVADALETAMAAASAGEPPTAQVVERLGQGWVAEEALAIGVYCALVYAPDRRGVPHWAFGDSLGLAANHGGDSDSTASICGNIMGVRLGQYALPQEHFLDSLEGREEITALADEFAAVTAPGR